MRTSGNGFQKCLFLCSVSILLISCGPSLKRLPQNTPSAELSSTSAGPSPSPSATTSPNLTPSPTPGGTGGSVVSKLAGSGTHSIEPIGGVVYSPEGGEIVLTLESGGSDFPSLRMENGKKEVHADGSVKITFEARGFLSLGRGDSAVRMAYTGREFLVGPPLPDLFLVEPPCVLQKCSIELNLREASVLPYRFRFVTSDDAHTRDLCAGQPGVHYIASSATIEFSPGETRKQTFVESLSLDSPMYIPLKFGQFHFGEIPVPPCVAITCKSESAPYYCPLPYPVISH